MATEITEFIHNYAPEIKALLGAQYNRKKLLRRGYCIKGERVFDTTGVILSESLLDAFRKTKTDFNLPAQKTIGENVLPVRVFMSKTKPSASCLIQAAGLYFYIVEES